MKKLSFLGASLISLVSFSQNLDETFKPDGDVQFKVFWNYHTDVSKNATQTSAFELERAYFGYQYAFNETISARVTLDVGNNTAGSKYTAFLKFAQLDWQVAPSVKLSMGVIGLQQFNDQENFWGYRYVFKSFQDENGFGSSADLGINAAFKISENLKANFLIVNGEGFRNLQDEDGKHKVGASLVYTPIKGLITKIYGDSQPSADGAEAITTFSLFTGYTYSKWKFGVEYNKLNNGEEFSTPAEDHNLNGMSFYTTYSINNKIEVFGRFDQLSSNTLGGEVEAWNSAKDGNQIIAGIQYVPVKGLSLSLNYQGYSFSNSAIDNKSLLFLSTEFKL
ncbi:hypothetical protein MKD41_13210 [Lutibacter sp. A64]|uniref:hypothetical protein n=1 Tax=Lutibacter sp. A64 TaxID=2918526 RepID=UPI001F0693C2|nr:hypothetical protein [Lutibacter sp. A64]UMB53287.1 hypothetical protein MKD41_13210 [Lutibacter sp. A64]